MRKQELKEQKNGILSKAVLRAAGRKPNTQGRVTGGRLATD